MSEGSAPDLLSDERFQAEVTQSDRVFDGAVWDVVRERFRFGDGELVREFMVHPGAVAILAQDTEDRVLLIKQYRHPIGYREWELPAGLLDVDGEAPLAAAQRELAEEADLVAGEWSQLCQFFSSPGGSSEVITVFLARSLSPTPSAFSRYAEEAEIEMRWERLNDVVAAVLDGRVRNSILANAVLNAHARR